MKKLSRLEESFRKAGLHLKVLDKPIRNGLGMDNIVQIDIQRKAGGGLREEWFRLYPGKGATIQVRDTDKPHKQLLLLVRETDQEFHETLTITHVKKTGDWLKNILDNNSLKKKDVVSIDNKHLVVRRQTPAETRLFLMGVDERQLFIAQLAGSATTVEGARKSLGSSVQFAEGKRRGSSIDRQGEWFFLETSTAQRQKIETLLKKNRIVLHKKVPIGQFKNRGGNPHTVDELVSVKDPDNELGFNSGARPRFPGRNDPRIFIRGKVRHKDHKTVHFFQWREVVSNNEGATKAPLRSATAGRGVFWVD